MTHYAYIHARPETVDQFGIFYVGKGAGKRYRPQKRRTRHHTNIVNKYGAENILIGTIECSSEASALELEIGLIKCLRRSGVKLVNLTDGGEGTTGLVASDETKAKLAERSLERWSDPEFRERISEVQKVAQKREGCFTEKKRASTLKNAETARARLADPEVRESARQKNSEHSTQMWSDPAHRAKVSASHKALWDEDRRAAKSLHTRGRIRVNNGSEEKNVFPEDAEALLANGWVRGRKPKVKPSI